MSVRSVLFVTLVLGVVANATPGEKSRKYCDETHVKATGRVRRIVGGIEAAENEFPHMVSLGYEEKNDISWQCAGSLISNKYVLTAASCISRITPKYAKLGTVDLDSKTEPLKIARVIRNPAFKPPFSYDDIGLIELEKPVEFSDSIRPACLNTEDSDVKHTFTATGWGLTSFNGNPSSKLLKVALEEVDNADCNKHYEKNRRLVDGIKAESLICAGGDHKDTCQGDSGAPLQILNPKYISTYDIHGVTSFGKACGFNSPAVYTRVSHYINWIESIVF
ncbi:PREDICTED: serine protease snake-like [Nicrophorus vespilloides]|uniref:Serine protease snake-like n=1 Tax=Nicrophorus vespilloides TaxID=110193 RepID=A0ABM1MEZ8_NICVS|nr:PREDICTED: serine protease snake-like [Nicrophorus vespilloides]